MVRSLTSSAYIAPSTCFNPSPVYARPFLKWAGGKARVLPQYLPYLPSFSTYYEPFLGGGAVFFHLRASSPNMSSAVLTDINPELVNVYRCIRDQVEIIIEQLQEHQQKHCRDYYYQMRATVPITPVERAVRILYLNKTCFNGLYRENSKGQFNVPMGRYKKPNICPADLLRAASIALKSVTIEVKPFESILELANRSQDFVYFDPPYHPISSTSRFTGYSRYAFRATEQIRLKEVFNSLADQGVKVMLSNSDCPFIRELYQDFHIHTVLAARSINSKSSKRGKITEVLVTSY